jgi:hypothetical protein
VSCTKGVPISLVKKYQPVNNAVNQLKAPIIPKIIASFINGFKINLLLLLPTASF